MHLAWVQLRTPYEGLGTTGWAFHGLVPLSPRPRRWVISPEAAQGKSQGKSRAYITQKLNIVLAMLAKVRRRSAADIVTAGLAKSDGKW